MNSYTPAELLIFFKTDLEVWARENKATLSIAKDPWHVLELLAESPAGLRVILHWAGDDDLGEQQESIGVSNHIEVILSYNLGLTARPDQALVSAQANRPALLTLLSSLRLRVLSLCSPDAETGVMLSAKNAGCESVITPEGIPLSAYKLKFVFDAALPDYTLRESSSEI